ncbi:glutamate racemase [Roseateles amylovorans]|uniref:Glutamate racemase n=1 Tax=Roseateles amylovorans TaxID=2978473 RepID=A0ABY6AXF6_9BURK|nr:glutamate racemase [Roseateles amylovorans]UXH77094.1 glutamate racemase [Roseateles amylovorans]
MTTPDLPPIGRGSPLDAASPSHGHSTAPALPRSAGAFGAPPAASSLTSPSTSPPSGAPLAPSTSAVPITRAGAALPPSLGVFDSGVGGLTVLKALRARLPDVPLHYVADAAHAPYGERSSDYIRERSLRVAEHLRTAGARMVVVACNTATAHAVNAMRERWPDWPVVGIEPGVKPAVAATRNGRIGVMATTATIASRRYEDLVAAHAGDVRLISQACPGLVSLIEKADLRSEALQQLIDAYCAPLRDAGVDTVLLGCTHYPLVQPQIQAALGPEVQVLNIEDAVARQAQRRWEALGLPAPAQASIVLESTGDPVPLERLAHEALGWTDLQATQISA